MLYRCSPLKACQPVKWMLEATDHVRSGVCQDQPILRAVAAAGIAFVQRVLLKDFVIIATASRYKHPRVCSV
jgi:hypothetical protein